ncbi:MAG: hypothetical protein HY869_12900 [Chloroflexi bacterium]|nr:hypothetical protein [Chloroflexota bacterium]
MRLNFKLMKLFPRIKKHIKITIKELSASLRKAVEHATQRRQMAQLYRQALPIDQSIEPLLFWVPGGMSLLLEVEAVISIAMRLRGVRSHVIICDGAYRACVLREATSGTPVDQWQAACKACKARTSAVLEKMRVPYSFIGDYVPDSLKNELWNATASVSWDTLDDLSYDGVKLGKSTRSAVFRYLQGEDLVGHEPVVREYAFSALVCAAASARAMEVMSPSRLFLSHGVYVDWGPALQTALLRSVPVAGWKPSYLYAHFYFRHIDDGVRLGFHRLTRAAWDERKASPLSPAEEARLDEFMQHRYEENASFDLQSVKPKAYRGEIEKVRQNYVSHADKPVWGIMCHINWDSVKDYSPMAFDSFNDWILTTVGEIVNIPEVHWLVKIHPVEANYKGLMGMQYLIDSHFPSLPPHVKVIPAEENLNPLEFFQLIDGGVSVYGTSGLELALQGKPVILAGDAHYGGKGFTYEGLSPDEYVNLLHRAASLSRLSEEQVALARRYAYSYFIQREVPLRVLDESQPNSKQWKFQYKRRHLLLPGKDPFMDFVCEHILNGKDFVMDENLVALAKGEV